MEKEENYSASMPPYFTGLDHSLDQQHAQDFIKPRADEASEDLNDNNGVVQYMPNNPQSLGYVSSTSLDRLSFADVMQFADFGPKLGLNQTKLPEEETGIDPVYFLKFPVLNDKSEEDVEGSASRARAIRVGNEKTKTVGTEDEEGDGENNNTLLETCGGSENSSVQLRFIGENNNAGNIPATESKNKRKRPRAIKTSEEVESQRMTHIAVERNRRKQMNEHLRVLRSLMPGSYVQRGDQASIIGGAIEFVRELEQLLQCLESQKRRRLFGDNPPRQVGDSSSPPPSLPLQQPHPPFFPPNLPLPPPEQMKFADYEAGLCEETAENKSCLADVEVKLLGFDAMIKILSRRRPGQLIKTIAALEDLQLNILHTNITTIEQTVLYSFNVKIAGEARFTADEIASSVQQIFSFIHANSII